MFATCNLIRVSAHLPIIVYLGTTTAPRREFDGLRRELNAMVSEARFSEAEGFAIAACSGWKDTGTPAWQERELRHSVELFRNLLSLPPAAQEAIAEAEALFERIDALRKTNAEQCVAWAQEALDLLAGHPFGQGLIGANAKLWMSSCLFEKHEFGRSEQFAAEGQEILARVLGSDHPFVGDALRSRAACRRSLSDFTGGAELSQEALRVHRNAFGDEHIEVADSLQRVSRNMVSLGDFRRGRKQRAGSSGDRPQTGS